MAQGNEVVFVDGVRTPFGRAGEKGQYWQTRSDDLIVKAMIGLLERNPNLPKDRVDDVAIAATTQTGDQGLTLGRTAAILAGLPLSVPGYAIDRMCAGAIAFGAYDIGIAGGVEHMGHHPMGAGAEPNPRFLAEKLNRCAGPVLFLLPEGGVSALDAPGQAFWDPDADAALFTTIEREIRDPDRVRRLPHNINDPEFADALVAAWREVQREVAR